MKADYFKTILICGLIALSAPAFAQKDLITISGVPQSTAVDPTGLSHLTLKALGHDGKEHSYTGVLLSDILAKGGLVLGNKRESISSYLVIKAKDNYRTIFSLAEVDPLFTRQNIIVADKIDGKALNSTDAPFQVIVPGDKIHTRWIRQVVSIEVVRVNP